MIALPTWTPDDRCPTPSRVVTADACLESPQQHDDRDQQLRPHHCARVRLREHRCVVARDLDDDDRRGSPYRRPCHCLCSREIADDRIHCRRRCSMLHDSGAGGTANLAGSDSPNALNATNPDTA